MTTDVTTCGMLPVYSFTRDDQVIIEGDICIVRAVDDDREDIDEILVKVENLTDPSNDEFPLFADDEYEMWTA